MFLREWCRARPAAQREHPLEGPAFLPERLAPAQAARRLVSAALALAREDWWDPHLVAGPPLSSYDPVLTGTIQGERAATPQANLFFSGGAPTVVQNTNIYNFAYTQAFATGTTANVSFNNSRITTNIPYDLLNPQISPNFRFQLTQHLLQGFGFDPNLRWIRIARNTRENGDIVFRQQIIATVSQVENIYWDLVTAYEAVRVNERALQLAQKTQSDDEEQIRIGTLAPITLAQAQSGVATAKQNLITSQTNLQLEQLLMKNAITKNMGDPILAVAPVIPTDTLKPGEQFEVRPIEDLIQEALQARPEIATARINLTNAEISRKALKNALRPSLGRVRVLWRLRAGWRSDRAPASLQLQRRGSGAELPGPGNDSPKWLSERVSRPLQQLGAGQGRRGEPQHCSSQPCRAVRTSTL